MAKTKKSALQQRIEEENARESVRYEAPKAPGGGVLPSGIQDGIAKLTRIDFDEIKEGDHKGENRFYCHGVCISPTEHEGIPIEGRLVQPGSITLADTESEYGNKTFAENMAKAENRLKLLGFPTQDFDILDAEALDYFEANKDNMYFRFSTWTPDGSERTVTMVRGVAENVPGTGDDVEDNTGKSSKASPKPAAKAATAAKTSKTAKVTEPEEEEEEEESLASLAKKADKGDKKAQRAVSDRAKAAGMTSDAIDECSNWTAVVEAIQEVSKPKAKASKGKASTKPSPKEEESSDPEKGSVVNFKPEGSRKLIECEVIKVLKRSQTVTLKALTSEEEYEDVSWDDLIEVSA